MNSSWNVKGICTEVSRESRISCTPHFQRLKILIRPFVSAPIPKSSQGTCLQIFSVQTHLNVDSIRTMICNMIHSVTDLHINLCPVSKTGVWINHGGRTGTGKFVFWYVLCEDTYLVFGNKLLYCMQNEYKLLTKCNQKLKYHIHIQW